LRNAFEIADLYGGRRRRDNWRQRRARDDAFGGTPRRGEFARSTPLEFKVNEAIQRVGPVMTELGFVSDLTFDNETRVTVSGNAIVMMLQHLGLEPQRHPACYYTIGLFEGFVQVLSKTRVSVVRQEFKDEMEIWTLME
jgi:hypothetical protein